MNDLIRDIKIYFRKKMLLRYFLLKHPFKSATLFLTGVTFISYELKDHQKKEYEFEKKVYSDQNSTHRSHKDIIYYSQKNSINENK